MDGIEQVTRMLPTLAFAVPLPSATLQTCAGFVGCVRTVTLYIVPAASAVANVNPPLAPTLKLSPPLSCSTNPLPARLTTVPPIVKFPPGPEPPAHATCTVDTLPEAVPLPPVTVQVCTGFVG